MNAAECRWVSCTQPARARGVCKRYHARTLRAGDRAATGAPRDTVMRAIAMAERPTTPTPDRLDDLAWLLECGEHPDRAARRCGWNRETALTVARRHGRHDLTPRLQREAVPA